MSQETTFSIQEISDLLHVAPQRLRQWEESFPLVFDDGSNQPKIHYSQADLATLLIIQRFFENGYSIEQIAQQLNGRGPTQAVTTTGTSELPQAHQTEKSANEQIDRYNLQSPQSPSGQVSPPVSSLFQSSVINTPRDSTDQAGTSVDDGADSSPSDVTSSTATSISAATSISTASVDPVNPDPTAPYLPERITAVSAIQPPATQSPTVQPLNEMVGDMLSTVAGSQQSMLNIQDSIREMLGVIVQDNFNLKTENRKLRDRMLELERTMAEYQRREETRKERLEGRLRAVEGTLSAMQQQLSQLVQLQRQKSNRRRFW